MKNADNFLLDLEIEKNLETIKKEKEKEMSKTI